MLLFNNHTIYRYEKVIILFAGLCIASYTFGQKLTLQSGISVSKLSTGYTNDKIGYSEFVGVDYFNKKYIDFSSNIGIIRKGGKNNIGLTDITLDYASINTLINIKYPVSKKFVPFLSIGPHIDYLFHSKTNENTINNTTLGNIFEVKPTNDDYHLKKISTGLLMVLGINYTIARYTLGIRYDRYTEFTKVGELPNAIYKSEFCTKTSSINVMFGYRLK